MPVSGNRGTRFNPAQGDTQGPIWHRFDSTSGNVKVKCRDNATNQKFARCPQKSTDVFVRAVYFPSNCRTKEVNLRIAKRIGGLCLSAVLLWGASYQFNSAFASGEQEQKGDSPALTIYNQQFAVVRQKLPLDLRSGVNHLQGTDITAHLEPDSVILHSLDSARHLQILEHNYRTDTLSQQLLLSLYEVKAINFLQTAKHVTARTEYGRIFRNVY